MGVGFFRSVDSVSTLLWKKPGLLPESHDPGGTATHAFESADGLEAQVAKILGAKIGDFLLFQAARMYSVQFSSGA
jgi:hypothetical protein